MYLHRKKGQFLLFVIFFKANAQWDWDQIGTHSWPTAIAQVSLSPPRLVKDPTGP